MAVLSRMDIFLGIVDLISSLGGIGLHLAS